jgi:hypothetical protein
MDDIIRELLRGLPELLAGLPLRYEDVPEDRKKAVITLALHCVLNGPVGVNKPTQFPLLGGPHKIKDFANVSNSSWKGFCATVAARVKAQNANIDCGTKRRKGDYWPLAE